MFFNDQGECGHHPPTGDTFLRNTPHSQEKGNRMYEINSYTGSLGCFPRPSNGMTRRISLAPKWDDSIFPTCLRGHLLSRAALESLIGRLNVARSTTFNSFAQGLVKPLYLMRYARPYSPDIPPLVRRSLYFWYATLSPLPPWVVNGRIPHPDYALFTDASYEEAPPISGLPDILSAARLPALTLLTQSGWPYYRRWHFTHEPIRRRTSHTFETPRRYTAWGFLRS